MILLQIDYWIQKKGHLREGRFWTYQSLRDLHSTFFYIPRESMRRAIKRLIELELVFVETKFNKRANDTTRWFALNEDGFARLESVSLVKVKTLNQNESGSSKTLNQNGLTLNQNGSTLPNYFPTSNTDVMRDAGTQELTQDEEPDVTQEDLDRLDDLFDEISDSDPLLLPSFRKRERELRAISEPIDDSVQMSMYRLCFRVETPSEARILTSPQRGRVASILGQLRDAGADFNRIHIFEAWWVKNWRSKDKSTRQYQAPRPEQVLEFWVEAMKSDTAPKVIEAQKPVTDVVNREALRHVMENRFKQQ